MLLGAMVTLVLCWAGEGVLLCVPPTSCPVPLSALSWSDVAGHGAVLPALLRPRAD